MKMETINSSFSISITIIKIIEITYKLLGQRCN